MSTGTPDKMPPPRATVTFIFASKYIFHRPEDLTQSISSKEIECVYKDGLFIVICPTSIREATRRDFYKAWQDYIRDALEKKKDALEGALVSEKVQYKPTFDWEELAERLERSPETQERLDRQQREAELEELPPFLLIEHETLSKDYTRKGLTNTPTNELYTPRILRDIQNATDCGLELNEVGGNVCIKGESEVNVERARVKLENLEKIEAYRLCRIWKFNFFITKHISSYRFCLVPDDHLSDRALLRTKLAYTRILKLSYVEHLRRYQVQTFGRQKIEYDWEASRFWLFYEYPAFGKVENNPTNWPSGSVASTMEGSVRSHPLLPRKKLDTVRAWVPKASNTTADPFQPKAEGESDEQRPTREPDFYLSTIRVVEGKEPPTLSTPAPIKSNDAPTPPAMIINDEWPSPETAMAHDSPLQQKASTQKAAAPITTQIATPALSFHANDPPVGPVARLAALNLAKMAAQSNNPPPIEAPFMPYRSDPKANDRHPSVDGAFSEGGDLARQPDDLSIEGTPMSRKSSRGRVETARPASRLNPRAPSFEPGNSISSATSKPLQSPLQPDLTWQNTKAQAEDLIDLSVEDSSVEKQPPLQGGFTGNFDGPSDLKAQDGLLIDFSGMINHNDLSELSSSMALLGAHNEDLHSDNLLELSDNERRIAGWNSINGNIPLKSLLDSSDNEEFLTTHDRRTHSDGLLELGEKKEHINTRTTNLLHFSDDEESIVERKKEVTEADTRLFFDGSVLKAPFIQPTTLKVNSQKLVFDKILAAAIEALDMIRAVRGQITLQLDLGRILVPRLPAYNFPYREGFSHGEWESHMDSAKPWSMGRVVAFSRVLTPYWFDAEWMIDCKDAQGTNMFNEGSRQSRVFYEFRCRNKISQAEYLITLDTKKGSYEITTAPKQEAEVNVLFLDHNWDAQLAARSQSEPEPFEMQSLISVIDNMYIPGGTKLPEIYTRCDKHLIEITSIVAKRRDSFESLAYPDFALQMTEVIDLPIQKSKHNQLYRAVAVEENLVKQNRRWYEASIISRAAAAVLHENVSLEVGEYARWTTERVAGAGFIQDLLDLASTLIPKMDGVGCPAEGFLPVPETEPERKAAAVRARAMQGLTSPSNPWAHNPLRRRAPVSGPPGSVVYRSATRVEQPQDLLTGEELPPPPPPPPPTDESLDEALWGPRMPPGFW